MLEVLKPRRLFSPFQLWSSALFRNWNLCLRLNTYKCRIMFSKPICFTRPDTTLTFLPMYALKPDRFQRGKWIPKSQELLIISVCFLCSIKGTSDFASQVISVRWKEAKNKGDVQSREKGGLERIQKPATSHNISSSRKETKSTIWTGNSFPPSN